MKLHRIITKPQDSTWQSSFHFMCDIRSDPRDIVPRQIKISPKDPRYNSQTQNYHDLISTAPGFAGVTRKYLDDNTLVVTYYFNIDETDITGFTDRFLTYIYSTDTPAVADVIPLLREFALPGFTYAYQVENEAGEIIPYEVPVGLTNAIKYWPFDSGQS